MIEYVNYIDGIELHNISGFFVGWPNPPSPQKHLELLKNSDYIWLAVDNERVVGFVTAISDNVLSAYIPLLEVLPGYQGLGIGTELVRRMLDSLRDLYMIDLMCDENLTNFYKRLGMSPSHGMIIRNIKN